MLYTPLCKNVRHRTADHCILAILAAERRHPYSTPTKQQQLPTITNYYGVLNRDST